MEMRIERKNGCRPVEGKSIVVMILMISIMVTPFVQMAAESGYAVIPPGATTGVMMNEDQLLTEASPSTYPEVKWIYATGGPIDYSSPCVADVDDDGLLEVLIGSGDYYVHCINKVGRQEWTYSTGGWVDSSLCIADVDTDGELEILGTAAGNLFCLSGTGAVVWSYAIGNSISSPTVADVDGDGKKEVVVASLNGKIYCINETGGHQWNYTAGGPFFSSPTIADLDGDGQLEVLASSYTPDNNVYCLSGTGEKEWNYTTGGVHYLCDPTVADVDSDGKFEVLMALANDDKICCLNDKGGLEWNYTGGAPCNAYIVASPVAADVDGDGDIEIIIESDADQLEWGRVYCLNKTGKLEWSYTTGGGRCSPSVADLDGDGQLEILVGARNCRAYCISGTGEFEWSFKTGSDVHSSPCVIDVDSDGRLEMLIGSRDGMVYCLSVYSSPFNRAAYLWPSIGYRGDIRHTADYNDTDKDGLTDNYEAIMGTDPGDVDTDHDLVTDYREFTSSTNPFTDTNPPARVANLASSSQTGDSITLTWTSPGDDGNIGNATGYILRYSTSGAITDANWGLATNFTQSWLPLRCGSIESHVVSGLVADTNYWFALKAYDDVHNNGSASNSPSAATLDILAPAGIGDLSVSHPTNTSVILTWTAPGDNGYVGIATGYVVKYSTSGPINDSNWDLAATYVQSWAPLPPGYTETHVVLELNPNTKYWFTVKALDERPNYGDISNSPDATTIGVAAPGGAGGGELDFVAGVGVGGGIVAIAVALAAIAVLVIRARKK